MLAPCVGVAMIGSSATISFSAVCALHGHGGGGGNAASHPCQRCACCGWRQWRRWWHRCIPFLVKARHGNSGGGGNADCQPRQRCKSCMAAVVTMAPLLLIPCQKCKSCMVAVAAAAMMLMATCRQSKLCMATVAAAAAPRCATLRDGSIGSWLTVAEKMASFASPPLALRCRATLSACFRRASVLPPPLPPLACLGLLPPLLAVDACAPLSVRC